MNDLGLEFLDPKNLELRKEHIPLTLGAACSLETDIERKRKGKFFKMCSLIQNSAPLPSGGNCTESR